MSSRYVALDIARIFAAAAVMVFHLGFWSWAAPMGTTGTVLRGVTAFPELSGFWWGRYGVETFFVISGFVIAFSASQSSAYRFAISRFLRLFPAAVICASITFAVWLWIDIKPVSDLITLYTRTVLFDPMGPWIDGVYWTLGIEIAFYAVIAVTLAAGLSSRLEAICVCIGLYSSVLWVANSLGYFPGIYDRTSLLMLSAHGVYFAIGAIVWSATKHRWTSFRISATIGFSGVGYLGIISNSPPLASLANASPHFAGVIWLASLIFIVAGTLVDPIVQKRLAPRALATIRFMGLATYSLYLVHDVTGAALLRCIVIAGVNRWVALLITFTIVLIAASIITAFLEPPIRQWIRLIIDRRTLADQKT